MFDFASPGCRRRVQEDKLNQVHQSLTSERPWLSSLAEHHNGITCGGPHSSAWKSRACLSHLGSGLTHLLHRCDGEGAQGPGYTAGPSLTHFTLELDNICRACFKCYVPYQICLSYQANLTIPFFLREREKEKYMFR